MEKERELIAETLNGNLSSFDQLMQKYQADVFLTVNRMIDNPTISHDICQNIFIKVFKNLSAFRFKCFFKTWLLKISVNETFSWIKKNRKRFDLISIDYENEDVVRDQQKNPEELLVESENRRHLILALTKLNPKYRNTVFLRYYEGKSLKEIAAIMSCSEGVVKNRLFRSLRKLKSILDELK